MVLLNFLSMHNSDFFCNPVSSSDKEIFSKKEGGTVLYFISNFDLFCNPVSSAGGEIFSITSGNAVLYFISMHAEV